VKVFAIFAPSSWHSPTAREASKVLKGFGQVDLTRSIEGLEGKGSRESLRDLRPFELAQPDGTRSIEGLEGAREKLRDLRAFELCSAAEIFEPSRIRVGQSTPRAAASR
jgi:hypothetical protein